MCAKVRGQICRLSGNFVDRMLETWFTMTMTTNYTEILQTWTDDMLAGALTGTSQAVRDENGKLRSLTDAEDAFLKAVMAERRRRGQ